MTMTLAWYAVVTSACAAFGALAAEVLLRQLGRPVRGAWVAALALSVALPVLAPLRQAAAPTAAVEGVASAITTLPLSVVAVPADVSAAASTVFGMAWLAVSVLLLLGFVGVHLRYRRLRTQWPAREIGGAAVLVAPASGPAVMGLVRPDIVVPRWLLTRAEREQRIVVTHEREHLRGGDPALLAGATLATILMPWNPAAWFMLARLRLAVEFDCDARVLRAGTLPVVYGNLLIDVAALSAGHKLPALALINPTAQLKRRLIAMHPDRVRFPRVRGAVLAAVAVLAVLAACEAAIPTDASVASLDAEKARQAAEQIGVRGDTVVYLVDGKQVTAADAEKIKAEDILRTTLEAKGKLTSGNVKSISIETKQAAEERAKVLNARLAQGGAAGEGAAQEVVVNGAATRILPTRMTDGVKVATEASQFTGLVFIDGKEVPASRMKEIAPGNIASVEVIKGVAAAKFYGERAKAGVIMIKTKP